MTTTPPYLRDLTVAFVPAPLQYRILQRIGNALYFCPCPDYPDSTPSLAVARTQLGTLKAWHSAQEHDVSNEDEYAFEAKSDGRFIAEYQVKETK